MVPFSKNALFQELHHFELKGIPMIINPVIEFTDDNSDSLFWINYQRIACNSEC